MPVYTLTNEQTRNFILLKHGLIGDYKFHGKEGVCNFVRQAGCIQFDPIDICGKNAELVLQSRVPEFTKEMLYQLLYEDRRLVDYFDKNLAIFPVEDWKYFSRYRDYYRLCGRSREKVDEAAEKVKGIIKTRGYACSKDIGLKETVDWSWNSTTLARAVLETLYFRGDLVIHHKKGTIKYYALAEDYLDRAVLTAEDPNKTENEYIKWQVLRRIGSVGLLWNKPSDAWLGIGGLKAECRGNVFSSLLSEGRLIECGVEGIKENLYCLSEDRPLLETVLSTDSFVKRVEFIAPLDNMLWDRKFVKALFGFDYKWEIYTPAGQRKYGYYVLPVLYGNEFAGRIEITLERKAKQLVVNNFWQEKLFKRDRHFNKALKDHLAHFARFNQCLNYVVK